MPLRNRLHSLRAARAVRRLTDARHGGWSGLAIARLAIILAATAAVGWPSVASAKDRPDVAPEFVQRPIVALDPLAVEQGVLTFRWTETPAVMLPTTPAAVTDGGIQGLGSAVTEPAAVPDGLGRIIRIETALATPTGCGEFVPVGGMPLGDGDYDHGAVGLGAPPSEGCLRVSLAVTDATGLTSVTSSEPYRVGPIPAEPEPAPPAPKRWTGKFNLYRANAFVTQKTFKWCVAASVQMMVNLVRNHTDRTTKTQRTMITYAQRWDNGPYGEEGGTDVTGWIRTLRHFGAGEYRAVGTTTPERALRIAATAMRQTGRPAGILVMEGRHAWVLHGFESRTDPKLDRRANIRAVRISGPLYPVQQASGYDPKPNKRLTAKALARYFQPTVIGEMAGKYVVIVPSH